LQDSPSLPGLLVPYSAQLFGSSCSSGCRCGSFQTRYHDAAGHERSQPMAEEWPSHPLGVTLAVTALAVARRRQRLVGCRARVQVAPDSSDLRGNAERHDGHLILAAECLEEGLKVDSGEAMRIATAVYRFALQRDGNGSAQNTRKWARRLIRGLDYHPSLAPQLSSDVGGIMSLLRELDIRAERHARRSAAIAGQHQAVREGRPGDFAAYSEAAVIMAESWWVRAVHNNIRRWIDEHARRDVPWSPRQPVTVLDIGSCTNPFGRFPELEPLALDLNPQLGKGVVKGDFLELPIMHSADVASGERYRIGPSSELQCLTAGSFDVVVLSLVLSYQGDAQQRSEMVARARRCLREGGLLIIVEVASCLLPNKYVDIATWDFRRAAAKWSSVIEGAGFQRLRFEDKVFEAGRSHTILQWQFEAVAEPNSLIEPLWKLTEANSPDASGSSEVAELLRRLDLLVEKMQRCTTMAKTVFPQNIIDTIERRIEVTKLWRQQARSISAIRDKISELDAFMATMLKLVQQQQQDRQQQQF